MSKITISDKRGGRYRAVVEFGYGECERLPFNLLRRFRARIRTLPDAGATATAEFNIRVPSESAAFLELLDLFGEDGSFRHGSAADPQALALVSPPAGLEGGLIVDDELEIEGEVQDLEDE